MAKIPDLKLGVEISSVAALRPGDTLVLGFSRHLDTAEIEDIAHRMSTELPGVRVAVLDQLAHMAAYRPPETT